MSEREEFLQEEWLRVRLPALRRGLARLSPATQSEYETLVTELEKQLRRNMQEPCLFVDCSTKSRRSPSASSSSWTAGRSTSARTFPINVDLCRKTGGRTLRLRLILIAATSGGDFTMSVPQQTVTEIRSSAVQRTSKKILIVDDDEAIRRLIKRLLQSEYELCEAASGRQSLEMLPVSFPTWCCSIS